MCPLSLFFYSKTKKFTSLNCKKEECAWYVKQGKVCAVRLLAEVNAEALLTYKNRTNPLFPRMKEVLP